MYFSVEVFRKDINTYVATCPELDVFSYGKTLECAVNRLKQIVQIYLDSADEMGMTLEELGLAPPDEKTHIPKVTSSTPITAVN